MSRESKEGKQSLEIISTRSKPQPILSLELTEEIGLENFYIGKLKEKKNISKAIKLLTSSLPKSNNFGYLKRCNGLNLLLSPVDNLTSNELKDILKIGGFDLSLLEVEFEIKAIPSKAARTKIQAEKIAKIWPLNFHPDPFIESIISGDIFNDKILSQIELFMNLAIEAARLESIGNSECNGSALIVDPVSGRPIALAASKLNEHPLWHASMLAIDLVAKNQGGGAWDLNKIQSAELENLECANERIKRKLKDEKPLCHPSSLTKLKFPENNEPLEKLNKQLSIVRSNVEEIHSNISNKTIKTGPYLCTNFWIFLTQEPCPLCAMALLHSRASKIFYGIKTPYGILGSKGTLHTTPGLNHRYQVWSGILEKECKILSEEMKSRQLL